RARRAQGPALRSGCRPNSPNWGLSRPAAGRPPLQARREEGGAAVTDDRPGAERIQDNEAEVALPAGELPESSRKKRAYLAHMRHELRTPLNAILSYGEMLLE